VQAYMTLEGSIEDFTLSRLALMRAFIATALQLPVTVVQIRLWAGSVVIEVSILTQPDPQAVLDKLITTFDPSTPGQTLRSIAGHVITHIGVDPPIDLTELPTAVPMRSTAAPLPVTTAPADFVAPPCSSASPLVVGLTPKTKASTVYGRLSDVTDVIGALSAWYGRTDTNFALELEFDLGRVRTVSTVSIRTAKGSRIYAYQSIMVSRSLDGELWSQVYSNKVAQACGPGREVEHPGWSQPTRFLRISLSKPCAGAVLGVADVRIAGCVGAVWSACDAGTELSLARDGTVSGSSESEFGKYASANDGLLGAGPHRSLSMLPCLCACSSCDARSLMQAPIGSKRWAQLNHSSSWS
jgi:hypothetical protein